MTPEWLKLGALVVDEGGRSWYVSSLQFSTGAATGDNLYGLRTVHLKAARGEGARGPADERVIGGDVFLRDYRQGLVLGSAYEHLLDERSPHERRSEFPWLIVGNPVESVRSGIKGHIKSVTIKQGVLTQVILISPMTEWDYLTPRDCEQFLKDWKPILPPTVYDLIGV